MAETIEGNARAFTLHNDGNFVAHIVLIWTHPETGKSGEYEQSGYHDICKYAERTVNLSDTDIPLGALVHLKVDVVLGKDNEDHKRSFGWQTCRLHNFRLDTQQRSHIQRPQVTSRLSK